MHLDSDFNHLAPDIAKIPIRKRRLHAFFWSMRVAHRMCNHCPLRAMRVRQKQVKWHVRDSLWSTTCWKVRD